MSSGNMNNPVRILYLEDNPRDAELVRDELQQVAMPHELRVASDRAEYEAAFAQTCFDLILSDYALPDYDGMSALVLAREKQPDVPFILISGTLGEEQAVDCMLRGATDFVLKQRLNRLVPAILRALGATAEHQKRRQVEEALRESEVALRGILNTTADGILAIDGHGKVIKANQQFANIWRIPQSILDSGDDQVLLNHVRNQLSDPDAFLEKVWALYGSTAEDVDTLAFKDGRVIERYSSPLLLDGSLVGRVWSFRDITDRKRVEAELLKMQKLQSVGTLAGGIAHDFNNILTGLYGNVSLAKGELSKDHPSYALLEEAETSMNRAIRLTKQLLTFSKGGDPVKENVSLGDLVMEVARFDLSGSNVRLVYQPSKYLWWSKVDKGQIQQVISNITINARQAMPDGGCLYITLVNAEIPEAAIPGLKQGQYVKVTVRDEGIGIDQKHIDRIFDPYFTTKQTGSGLGLATAYSVIKKHGGHIAVVSELGKGTTLTIHLPACESPQRVETKQPAAACPPPVRPARILLMDDEEPIRKMVPQILEPCGFSVETASDGQEAIEKFKQAMEAGAPFDVVIMDLTIPGGIGGKEAIKAVLAMDPQARAIVSSGYADDPVMSNHAKYGFKGIVIKPYTTSELREALGLVLKEE